LLRTRHSDFLFLAMAHQGRGDKAEAEDDYARGAELASKTAANNAELKILWSEAANPELPPETGLE
jgi:hypothetical protein